MTGQQSLTKEEQRNSWTPGCYVWIWLVIVMAWSALYVRGCVSRTPPIDLFPRYNSLEKRREEFANQRRPPVLVVAQSFAGLEQYNDVVLTQTEGYLTQNDVKLMTAEDEGTLVVLTVGFAAERQGNSYIVQLVVQGIEAHSEEFRQTESQNGATNMKIFWHQERSYMADPAAPISERELTPLLDEFIAHWRSRRKE